VLAQDRLPAPQHLTVETLVDDHLEMCRVLRATFILDEMIGTVATAVYNYCDVRVAKISKSLSSLGLFRRLDRLV
jgi:hypothetical protein